MSNDVSQQYDYIMGRVNFWYKQLGELQEVCSHRNVARKARSNTGGYDGPAYDRYWYDCKCPDCGKSWVEDK